MLEGLLTAAAFAAMYASFALLALSQESHWEAVAGAPIAPPPAGVLRRWRCGAGAGLAFGCALCLLGNGIGFGLLLSVLALGAGSMGVALTLAWKPGWLRAAARLLQA